MKKTICALVLVCLTAPTAPAAASGQDSPDLLRRYAEKLPIGVKVAVRIAGGERLTGVLMLVDDTGITVKQNTRIPEPARQIAYDRLVQLEVKRHGDRSLARSIAIGAGVGGATVLGVLLAFAAAWD